MNESVHDHLAAARAVLQGAKSIPLSSNVAVNRDALFEALDAVEASLGAEASEGDGERDAILAQARAEADRIVAQARERADALVGEDGVRARAAGEADALKSEADTWVDGRLAEFETGLHRTLEQIATLRGRLADRTPERDERAADDA